MQRLLIAGILASTILSAPAVARDNSAYVGLEGGLMKVKDVEVDLSDALGDVDEAFTLDHNTGVDLDFMVGYDFGLLRAEAELGYKRAGIDDITVDPAVLPTAPDGDFDGRTRVLSGMVNLLLDFGNDDGLTGFVGGGVGVARTKIRAELEPTALGFSGKDRALAWQLLAGIRTAVSDNIDLGLKYRFFHTKFDFSGDSLQGGPTELDGRFRSHSLLASLIYNFRRPVEAPPPPPPPAPPPPPPAPATQTCPDGSVILTTDACPAPPPPPPPPPPEPERG